MQIEQLPDFEHDEAGNFGTSTILVDGIPYVVVDYYDRYAPIAYKVLKDGAEVEPVLAKEIYKAYNGDLESFIDEIVNNPPLEEVES